MKKGIKKIVITAGILLAVIIVVNIFAVNGGEMFENLFVDIKLDEYSAKLDITSDGKLHVNEKHYVNFDSRDEDWWNYYKVISTKGYGNARIDLDSVVIKVNNIAYPKYNAPIDFDNSFNANNHSKYKGYSYYNPKNVDAVEIGVVMPDFHKGKRTIEISYTIDNILIEGRDIASFYYKIIDESNTMPIDKLNTVVTFPANNEDTLRTWLHIDEVPGQVEIVGNSSLKISAIKVPAHTYVETRTTLDKANYSAFAKTTIDTFESIKAAEKADYEKAIKEGKRLKQFIFIDVFVGIIAFVACIALGVTSFIKKKRRTIHNAPIYLHEPPQDFSMEEAMPIYHYYDNDNDWWSDVISGTMLNLVRKKYLTIMPGEKKKEAKVLIINMDRDSLSESEALVMDMLEDASGGLAITMKDFEKWCRDNYIKADKYMDDFKAISSKRGKNDRLIPIVKPKPNGRGLITAIIGICMSVCVFFASNPFFTANILIALGGVVMYVLDNLRSKPLSKLGETKFLEFSAFAKYMLDFSSFDRKTIPELVLWEEYMVWATGMGIADEVSKQLSIVYPEIDNSINIDDDYVGEFTYWYMFSPRFRMSVNFASSMRDSMTAIKAIKIQNTIDKATRGHSGGAGSGHGGGSFSGGGGGFGGGGMGSR